MEFLEHSHIPIQLLINSIRHNYNIKGLICIEKKQIDFYSQEAGVVTVVLCRSVVSQDNTWSLMNLL